MNDATRDTFLLGAGFIALGVVMFLADGGMGWLRALIPSRPIIGLDPHRLQNAKARAARYIAEEHRTDGD